MSAVILLNRAGGCPGFFAGVVYRTKKSYKRPQALSFRFFRDLWPGSKNATVQREKDRNPDSVCRDECPFPCSKNTVNTDCSSIAALKDRFRSFRGLAHPSIHVFFPPRKTGMTRCFWVFETNRNMTLFLVTYT